MQSAKTYYLLSSLIITNLVFTLFFPPEVAEATCEGLFISEYVEGSSNNKAIEIFNGYAVPVDLSNYQIRMYFNGSSSAGTTVTLSGIVNSGDVFVLSTNNSVDADILAVADQTSGSSFYNGDDAVQLYRVDTATSIDVIGEIGFDPGSEWGSGLQSTANNTIQRKATVVSGDSNGADAFDPSIEWDGFATDTFSGLGSHTFNCTPTAVTLSNISTAASSSASAILFATGLMALGTAVFLRRRAH